MCSIVYASVNNSKCVICRSYNAKKRADGLQNANKAEEAKMVTWCLNVTAIKLSVSKREEKL